MSKDTVCYAGKSISVNFLDCMLRGKFTRAGEGACSLFLKEGKDAGVSCPALNTFLDCQASRSRSSGVSCYFTVTPIHLKSAIKATRAILDCMSEFDDKLFLRFSIFQLFSIFRSLCSIPYSNFIKILKYFTAYPLAFFLRNDLPEKPCDFDTNYPFVGNHAIRRWWKERMIGNSHYNVRLRLFWSLLQGVKRACEFADDSFIESSMQKHKDLLSRDHPVDVDLEQQYWDQFNIFFKGFKPRENLNYEISNSACSENTRSNGGSRQVVLDYFNDIPKNSYSSLYRIMQKDYCSQLYSMHELSPGKVRELRGVYTPSLIDLATQCIEKPEAHVSAILEPLKVRLITKGPSFNYFLSKSYQKSLFQYLRQYDQFELIGVPLEKDHIYRMIEREKNFHMDFTHFVSGDYSSATDNLGIQYTMIGMNASLQNYQGNFKNILKSVLFEHEVHYPDRFKISPFQQTNGQLMGSPLSFPFLCTTNLIAYKLSLEEYLNKKVNFKDLPCLVNGDDILFRTNPDHYEIWKKHVKNIGFTLSIGKNYIHKKVLTINSTMFKQRKNEQLDQIEYCNFGLLSGTSKLGGSRGEVREKAIDLRDAYIKSVGSSVNKSLAYAKFLSRNSESISKITYRGRYNLFLPRELGGLDFPSYDGVNFHVTRFQRLLAKSVLKSKNFSPLFGFKTTSSSNMIMGYESKNTRSLMIGMGPLRQFDREVTVKQFTEPNSSYLNDTDTKWFTKIPQRYNPKLLFPFRLKSSDDQEYQKYSNCQFLEGFGWNHC